LNRIALDRRATIALLILPVVGVACTPAEPDAPVRIAFIQDLSAPDADEHVQPALQAAELAVAMRTPAGAAVELVPFDVAEEPEAVMEIAADDTFVAAIVGPGAEATALAEAGVPTISVSTAGPEPASGPWRRLVASIDVLADVMADELQGARPCAVSEDPAPDALAAELAERIAGASAAMEPGEVPAFVDEQACDVVAWTGSADPAAELSHLLPPGIELVGGDRLLDPDFADDAAAGAGGTRSMCACRDVSTSTDPAVLRFIQDYQSEFGTAPGAYAVEAWDAAGAVLDALSRGSSRDAVADAVGTSRHLEGLGVTYTFGTTGALEDPESGVNVRELSGGRWAPVEG
jgi:branched-chain amino acid transport system substrate-binding protein